MTIPMVVSIYALGVGVAKSGDDGHLMTTVGDKGQTLSMLGKDGVGGLSSKAALTRCGRRKWWRCLDRKL
jgi:hypothetical protein